MELLFRILDHQGALAVVMTALLLVSSEVAYRRGLRLHKAGDELRRGQIASAQAAVIGMLGLLVGFTFSMAVDRYDTRRRLVVEEANTIGTTWLRAGLLSGTHRDAVRHLLREYVDIRIGPRNGQRNPQQVAEALRRSEEIQSTLWRHAEAAAREAPTDITATFIETLNAMIDTGARRVAATRSRIPPGVWLILMVVAAIGCCMSGFAAGVSGVRAPLKIVLLPLLLSLVTLLIFDLTSERKGVIRVSRQPLLDLQESIRRAN